METKENSTIFQINVADIVGKKWLPKWALRPLENLICQDEINYYLSHQCAGKTGLDFVRASLDECLFIPPENVTIEGIEKIPRDGRYTFVSNHPLGCLDGLILLRFFAEEYNSKVKLFLNKILAENPHLADFAIPVNKGVTKREEISHLRECVDSAYAGDDQIIVFPAGTCSRLIAHEIQDLPWKTTFYTKSLQYHRGIVPIYFKGCNSNFYYSFVRFFEKIGVKKNVGMILLAREMLSMKHRKFTIVIGDPIPAERLEKLSKNYTIPNAVSLLRHIVYLLN